MPAASQPFVLRRRAVARVHGPEAAAFLDRLLTVDASGLSPGMAQPAALLTPQGKILHELVIHPETGDGTSYCLDAPHAGLGDLLKRLTLFKLRSRVVLESVCDRLAVIVDLTGARWIGDDADEGSAAEIAAYDAWRVAEGRPEQGVDYGSAEVFPAEANLDLLGGVDYAKGCFVGQEVVSRMKRRGVIRKRTLVMTVEGGPPAVGAEIRAESVALGQSLSSAGGKTLALVRLDRLAQADPATISCEGRPAQLAFPAWFPEDARRVAGEDAA
jgi:folate-binding protein YgfZ